MSQVVHVIDAACGLDALLEAAELAGPDERLLCIGPPPGWEDSPPCFGFAGRVRTVSLWRLHSRRARKLRRLIAPDAVVHCWSVSAAAALDAADPIALPPILRLTAAAGQRELHELRHLCETGRKKVVCVHAAIAEVVAEAEPSADVKVIGPLACPLPAGGTRRAKARKKLGLAEEEVAIAAPGAPGRRSGHRLAVWATAILAVAEAPVRVVIQETGQAARKVAKFARQAGFAEQTILAAPQVSLPEILAAADVAVFLAPDGMPPVHLASAMSAGLPIVAAETSAAGQWLTFGRNALPAAPEDPRDIARALLRLIEDRELAGRLGRSARRTAGRRFHPRSIREQWAEVYADVSAARPCPAG